MDKKYRVNTCYWCPHSQIENGAPLHCRVGMWTKIKPEDVEERNEVGELVKHIIPGWCPLEDYQCAVFPCIKKKKTL